MAFREYLNGEQKMFVDDVFNGKIEYEKIIYPTTKTGEKPAILKQKKSSNNENFSSNLKWQSQEFQEHTKNMKIFVKHMLKIYEKYEHLIERINFKLLN